MVAFHPIIFNGKYFRDTWEMVSFPGDYVSAYSRVFTPKGGVGSMGEQQCELHYNLSVWYAIYWTYDLYYNGRVALILPAVR